MLLQEVFACVCVCVFVCDTHTHTHTNTNTNTHSYAYRRTGRHLCYRMNLVWQDGCSLEKSKNSKVKPCADRSVVKVKEMCTTMAMSKLPGVNVNNWGAVPKMQRGTHSQKSVFYYILLLTCC